MKKETRNVLLLCLFSILLISFVAGVVSAAPTTNAADVLSNSLNTFFGHWASGTGLGDFEAKILLALLIFTILIIIASFVNIKWYFSFPLSVILTFMFTAYITPDAILGIFQSYQPLPLTIATLLPLLVFFALTYIAADKGIRTLMTLQIFAWFVYFVYAASKPVLGLLFYWFGSNWFGIDWQITSVPTWGTVQAAYFWLATGIAVFISFIMTFFNGYFMKLAIRMSAGAKDEVAEENLSYMKRGMRGAKELGKELGGENTNKNTAATAT